MKKKKKKKNSNERCPYLYIDIFGHPYCTGSPEKMIDCKYFIPSEEYKAMKQQIVMQKDITNNKVNSLFKVPSTYRCMIYDNQADNEGHLPEHFRDKLNKKVIGMTVKF